MSENSAIEWCNHTFNPWFGCAPVSPGCENCYAEAMMDTRLHRVQWGAGKPRIRTSPANWKQPLKWNAAHAEFFSKNGHRQRVFCASLADVFDNAVVPQWRADLFRLIRATPNLDWLLLTKRIGNVPAMVMEANAAGLLGGEGFRSDLPPNVWLGATVVNQAEADRDIPKLLAVPAAKRFLSMEPLLGTVDLRLKEQQPCTMCVSYNCELHGMPDDAPCLRRVDWVIVGGESGPNARPMHPGWARSLRDQCRAAGVPFLFKQWGTWGEMGSSRIAYSGPVMDSAGNVSDWMHQEVTYEDGSKAKLHAHSWGSHTSNLMYRIGKKAAGRLLDGRTHDGFPN